MPAVWPAYIGTCHPCELKVILALSMCADVNSDDKVERTSRALTKDASALYTQDDL